MDVPGYALITGGASGMGRECAKKFAEEGAAGVAILDLNASALTKVKDEVQKLSNRDGFKAVVHQLDVSNEDQVNQVVQEVASAFGRIDYVVNAAGIVMKHPGGAAFVQTKDWSRVLNINLTGTFFVIRATAKIMLEQEPLENSKWRPFGVQRGSIVNFASILGLTGVDGNTAYTSSKHAVIGLTKTVSEDYAAKGLRINAICPGYIDTPMNQGETPIERAFHERATKATPMGRCGQPAEVADGVLFLCGGRSSFVTGSALVVDGGFTER